MRPCVSVVRHALHAVHAALEPQPGEDAAALDRRRRLPCSRRRALALREDLDLPALQLGIARYMRNRSPAKSAASSPPVPARTSRMALFSSAASLGRSTRRRSRSSPRSLVELAALLLGERRHLGIVAGSPISASRPASSACAACRRGWRRRPASSSASSRDRRDERVAADRAPEAGACVDRRRRRATRRVEFVGRAAWLSDSIGSAAGGACRTARDGTPCVSRESGRAATRRPSHGLAAVESARFGGSLPASSSSSIALTGPIAAGDIDSERKPRPISAIASSGLPADLAAQRHRARRPRRAVSAISFQRPQERARQRVEAVRRPCALPRSPANRNCKRSFEPTEMKSARSADLVELEQQRRHLDHRAELAARSAPAWPWRRRWSISRSTMAAGAVEFLARSATIGNMTRARARPRPGAARGSACATGPGRSRPSRIARQPIAGFSSSRRACRAAPCRRRCRACGRSPAGRRPREHRLVERLLLAERGACCAAIMNCSSVRNRPMPAAPVSARCGRSTSRPALSSRPISLAVAGDRRHVAQRAGTAPAAGRGGAPSRHRPPRHRRAGGPGPRRRCRRR